MLSIGEFSRVSNLTVKTLRYYHEIGILLPGKIDGINGYRYYGEDSFSRVESIGLLKSMGFSMNEIKRIFDNCQTDEDLNDFIREKMIDVESQIKELQSRKKKLGLYNNMTTMNHVDYSDIKETSYGGFWICSIRFIGTYIEIGEKFKILFKQCGPAARGKGSAYYYDMEHKENEIDIEAVLPVSKELRLKGINCRKLEENRAVSLVHQGPYGSQGSGYLMLFAYCREKGYTIKTPIIESYLRGPGLFFKGNEAKYLTELTILIE